MSRGRGLLVLAGSLLLLMVAPLSLRAADTTYGPVQGLQLRDCDDARTCRFDVPGWPAVVGRNLPVRLEGLDVPDPDGACARERRLGREARRVLVAWLTAADTLTLRQVRRSGSFRLVARLQADGRNVADRLIEERFARSTDRVDTDGWCPAGSARHPDDGSDAASTASGVVIKKIDPEAQRILLENQGSSPVDLGGWVLVAVAADRRFEFPPDFSLEPGAGTIVTSGPGAVDAPPYFLRWTGTELWEDTGDTAYLLDAEEERVSRWPR